MTCKHLQLRVCGNPEARAHGTTVPPNVCSICPHYDGPSRPVLQSAAKPSAVWRGLGDVVAAATSAVGITPCGGCKERQEALNRLVPFAGGGSPSDPPAPSDPPSDRPQT